MERLDIKIGSGGGQKEKLDAARLPKAIGLIGKSGSLKPDTEGTIRENLGLILDEASFGEALREVARAAFEECAEGKDTLIRRLQQDDVVNLLEMNFMRTAHHQINEVYGSQKGDTPLEGDNLQFVQDRFDSFLSQWDPFDLFSGFFEELALECSEKGISKEVLTHWAEQQWKFAGPKIKHAIAGVVREAYEEMFHSEGTGAQRYVERFWKDCITVGKDGGITFRPENLLALLRDFPPGMPFPEVRRIFSEALKEKANELREQNPGSKSLVVDTYDWNLWGGFVERYWSELEAERNVDKVRTESRVQVTGTIPQLNWTVQELAAQRNGRGNGNSSKLEVVFTVNGKPLPSFKLRKDITGIPPDELVRYIRSKLIGETDIAQALRAERVFLGKTSSVFSGLATDIKRHQPKKDADGGARRK